MTRTGYRCGPEPTSEVTYVEPKYTTPKQMRERLIERATEDETFRARLLSDPKAAVHEELGLRIPAGYTVQVHEEAADTGHLVLPPSAQLDEAALGQAAGGGSSGNDELATLWDDW